MATVVVGTSLASGLVVAGASADEPCQVKPDEVKTWTTTIAGREYEVRPATPAYEGDTGLFHLSSAYTLPKGKVSFSLFRDNLDRDPKDLDLSIHGVSLGYGATDKFEIFGNFGLQNRANVDARFQPGFVNDYPFAGTSSDSPGWQTGVGDVKLGAKYKFLNDYLGDSVGLAVRGLIKLPTADEVKGLGTGKVSGAADLILSKSLNRGANIHASIGYEINSDPDDLDIGNAFRWGVGLNLPSCRIFQLQAEVTGKVYSGADFDQTSPVDLVVGPVFWIKPGVFIRPAISWNLAFDDRGLNSGTSSKTGRQVSVGFHPGTACCEVVAPPPPPPPPANRPPTVTVTCDSPVLAGAISNCTASASDPDGDPITYGWTSGAGRISGNNAAATLDTTGMKEKDCTPVTVRVSDGRGGTAEATTRVCVKQPEKKAEAILLCSLGFAEGAQEATPTGTFCLDDVASRLNADPSTSALLVGHADSKERYPEVIARKRAEAIKDYLVKERGVEEARISVRSAGASKALDTGATAAARAKNRRVEVIFVPEGAIAGQARRLTADVLGPATPVLVLAYRHDDSLPAFCRDPALVRQRLAGAFSAPRPDGQCSVAIVPDVNLERAEFLRVTCPIKQVAEDVSEAYVASLWFERDRASALNYTLWNFSWIHRVRKSDGTLYRSTSSTTEALLDVDERVQEAVAECLR